MSNIEVGDYVKDKYGVIGKVKKIAFDDEALEEYCYFEKSFMGTYIKDIVNHSKNIIDLIEVGDYVNGYRILEIEDINNCNKKAFTIFKKNEHCYVKLWKTEDIKSIVTKEMFLNAEYKVGEQV